MTAHRPYLLDVTRLVALGWTGGRPTGIDRVCDAYLQHYRSRAYAVVQHRGVYRTLNARDSDALFGVVARRGPGFRSRMLTCVPGILRGSSGAIDGGGQIYLNVGHTEFDLPSHRLWVDQCSLRAVYLIHDLIPIERADICTPHATRRHRGRVVNALGAAAGIIANSHATAKNLRAFASDHKLRLPPVIAAHLGLQVMTDGLAVVRSSSGDDQATVRIPRPYLISVGTIEPRKNHMTLLRVWQRLIAGNMTKLPHLVLIGQWGRNCDPVRTMLAKDVGLARHVTLISDCDDRRMASYVQGARALLLPTLAEGFGLPLIEAMALGVPVVASDIESLRELGEGIPLFLDPVDEMAWENAIRAMAHGGPERRRQLALLPNYQPPSWTAHFHMVDEWLKKTINRADKGLHVHSHLPRVRPTRVRHPASAASVMSAADETSAKTVYQG